MTYVLRSKLPSYVVDHIKLFTGEGAWRNGKYINIHRIPSDDPRYEMLRRRPKIKQLCNDSYLPEQSLRGCTWFKTSENKFMVITVRYGRSWHTAPSRYGHFWEMHYDKNVVERYLGN